MAITENTYTGNNSTTNFSFSFPYLSESDVKVSLDDVDQPTTAYSFANATTISFVTAPGTGVAIRIYRQTAQDAPPATFFAGSAIRAQDLNENFLQQLYVAQETANIAGDLTTGGIAPGSITSSLLADNSVTSSKIVNGTIVNADINSSAEIAVSKLADGSARQLLQTDASGNGVEWTSNVDIPGTLDVTSVATFDNTVTVAGNVTVPSLNGGPLAGTRNRIINGDMRIDQRNNGASVSGSGVYAVDRFRSGIGGATPSGAFSSQRVATSGLHIFPYALQTTVTTATTPSTADEEYHIYHFIEGFNVDDYAFGNPGWAATITISFWVRSSVFGTYGFSLKNHDVSRSYSTSYTIINPNVWEFKTITIPGDTAGSWLKNNGIGLECHWSLGAASNRKTTGNAWVNGNYSSVTGAVDWIATPGATFTITGVQLERGATATIFERRSYGQELSLCQRYYQTGRGILNSGTITAAAYLPVTMRAEPSVVSTALDSGSGGAWAALGNSTLYQSVFNSVSSGSTYTASAEFYP